MKCKYCGSNLTIDDEICPFCGKPNPFAVKHRSQMRFFRNEFNQTKEDVVEKSNRFNSWTVRITIIAVLLALDLLLIVLMSNSWEIHRLRCKSDINRNLLTYSKTMAEYEQNEDFIGLSTFYETKYLSSSEHFDEYRQVNMVCTQYKYFYQYLMECTTMEEDAYFSMENRIEYMVEQLSYIYKYSKQEEYSDQKCFTPQHVACMNAVVKQCNLLLKTYCNVSDEDLERFPNISNARKQIIVERGLGLGE